MSWAGEPGCPWEEGRKQCAAKNNCEACGREYPHDCRFCGECMYLFEDGIAMACGLHDEKIKRHLEETK